MRKRMKRAGTQAVLLLGAGFLVATAGAQDMPSGPPQGQQGGPRGGMRATPEMRANMLQKQLGLTADVTAQVKTIFTAGTAKMEALRSNQDLPRDDMRKQMMAIHSDEVAKVSALLTPDQQTKYAAMEAQPPQRGMGGRGQGGPPPDGAAPPPPQR